MRASFASCCNRFAVLSRSAAKAAGARLRRMGLMAESDDWARRAVICERCPLRTVYRGVSYCGKPFLQKVDRDETIDGCGCPCQAKAKSPKEHCPLDLRNRHAVVGLDGCTCKWCATPAAR